MALKFKYKAKEEIPAEHLSFYVERDGALDQPSGTLIWSGNGIPARREFSVAIGIDPDWISRPKDARVPTCRGWLIGTRNCPMQ